MKGKYCVLSLVIATVFSTISISHAADEVRGTLPFHAEPSEQWLLAFDGGRPRFIPARVSKSIDSLTVSGAASDGGVGGYVAAVVLYADGSVRSTPLHRGGDQSRPNPSSATVEEQQALLKERRLRIDNLEKELSKINESVKRTSGLTEVDAIYEKIAEIDREIAEEERSRRSLESIR
jgi:hypothetical protein